MDLSKLFDDVEKPRTEEMPRRLLAPEPNIIPLDSQIEFAVVETIKDILDTEPNKVLLFSEPNHALLECVVKYSELFGFEPAVLSGVPSADYSARFDSKTYSLERISYPSLVNELLEAKRVKAVLADEGRSAYDKEREQFTRRTGKVKELTGTRLAGKPGAPSPFEDATASDD